MDQFLMIRIPDSDQLNEAETLAAVYSNQDLGGGEDAPDAKGISCKIQ